MAKKDPHDVNLEPSPGSDILKDVAAKWKRNFPCQFGSPAGIDRVYADSTGPTQLVPQSLKSLIDTLRVNCIEMQLQYTNQKYAQNCQQ